MIRQSNVNHLFYNRSKTTLEGRIQGLAQDFMWGGGSRDFFWVGDGSTPLRKCDLLPYLPKSVLHLPKYRFALYLN